MRKTKMKRGKGLKRTPMNRGKSTLQRSGRLKQVGKRAKRDQDSLDDFRAAIRRRCIDRVEAGLELPRQVRYRCERCGGTPPLERFHCHHIKPKGRGGTNDPITNGAGLCSTCHSLIHDHNAPDYQDWIR